VIYAVDGISFGGRDTLLAYRSGVTTAVTPPTSRGPFAGLSVAINPGAAHKLEKGAIVQDAAALHVSIGHFGRSSPSISTQIAALRRLLLYPGKGEKGQWVKQILAGNIPLVINVDKADHIASLLYLKKEVENVTQKRMRVTLSGSAEAHLLAQEIADAKVGVILTPSRPFPYTFDQLRILPGPPLTQESAVTLLLKHNVTVGVGILEEWMARNTRFDIAWAALESNGTINKERAIALATSNLDELLGVNSANDLVAYKGGDMLSMSSKVVAVVSKLRAEVDLF
jgi:hypothetical protein